MVVLAEHNIHRRRAGGHERFVPMQLVAQRLRQRARELKLSDAEVARRAGLSERRYAYYATGEREPNLETLLRICEVLAVTPNDMLLASAKSRGRSERERLMDKVRAAVNGLSAEDLALTACQVECLLAHRAKSSR